MRDLFVQTGQVELVLDAVLVDLAEERVAAKAAEPGDPTHFFRATHVGFRRFNVARPLCRAGVKGWEGFEPQPRPDGKILKA